ncbi:MAG: hypothetical protein K2N43_06400 [Lachnospiraceae bacterium]|nr:hypothetical protein [Lachnospiraceae bacterium]
MIAYEKRWGKGMDKEIELCGWLAAKNLKIDCLGEVEDLGECLQYSHLLDKFPRDRVYLADEQQICFMDGYVYNKSEFMGRSDDWQQAFADSLRSDAEAHLQRLRGAFCGYACDVRKNRTLIYTDQVSNKALYYYTSGERWIISNCVDFIVRVLRANHIAYHFDQTAARYMLSYGYMLDDSTYVKEIRRLLPGCFAVLKDGRAEITQYYRLRCHEQPMTEDEALDKLDQAFRQAVAREFEKDKEYGYDHLVDLSAGLDSRMVCWVAHDMGYTQQTNLSYSKLGYRDDTVSGEIAKHLGHEYLFKSLDDVRWMYDVDEMTLKNNGAAICLGMTGGNRMLKSVNMERFGIENTGIIGGPTMASYYKDRELAYGPPRYGLNGYSTKLRYTFDEKVLQQHETQEAFAMNTRGLLGMQVSYMIRQNYIECASPFADVDMLETAFSIPFAYRVDDKLYLRWIAERYPGAAEFGWEKWGGVKPKRNHIFFRKVKTTQRLLYGYCCRIFHKPNPDSMNPMDYWYAQEEPVRRYLEHMYEQRIDSDVLPQELAGDMRNLYQTGNFIEKCLVLTVLSAVYLYFETK